MTHEMIAAALTARDLTFFVDEDGDLAGLFRGNVIYFFRIGEQREILHVRAMTQHFFGLEDVPKLYEFCNSWNRDRLFPKAYVNFNDDATVTVVGDVLADWEKGVTAEQLDQVLVCAIATSCQLADALLALREGRPTS